MPMKVEAAIVTQKRPEAAYNTDSVNVNGKVMPREVIRNGYKGSGVLGGSVYFALTSSDVEGFADATVTAFNQRAELFARSRNPVSVFSGFFEDCRGALINMDRAPEELTSAGFFATGRRAVLAYNGKAGLYLQRMGILTPVSGEKVADTIADFNSASFNDVCVDDIFILLSPGAAAALTDKDIEDILKISDGSVKKIVNYILKVALSKSSDKAVSAIVVKVLETAIEEEIAQPIFEPEVSEEEKTEAENEPAEAAEDVPAEEAPAEEAPTEETAEATDDIAAIFSKNALEMFEESNTSESEEIDEAEYAQADAEAEEILYTEALEGGDDAEDIPEEYDAEAEAVFAEAEEDADAEELDDIADAEEKPQTDKKKTILLFVAGVLIPVVIALLVFLVIVPAFSGEEETTAEDTTVEETTEEETTEEETTEEETTEEETTEETTAETTTKREETTTRRPATETTTARPVVAPVTTTEASTTEEATTAAEDTTAAEEAPSEEEGTTAAQEETTEATTEAATEATTEAATEEQAPVTEGTSAEENTDAQ